MKQVLWGVAIFLVLTTAVRAEEVRTEPVKADSVTEDCSKQVWPKLFPVVPPQHRSNGECSLSHSGPSLRGFRNSKRSGAANRRYGRRCPVA